ncbi:hypothetical protein JCM14469_25960 [Desulfatiferula olefinivorans]
MKPIKLILCSVLIVVWTASAGVCEGRGAGVDADVREMTRLLMEKCGINEQIDNVPEKTQAEVRDCFRRNEALLGKISDQVIDEINGIIGDAFKPSAIRAILADYIGSRLSLADMQAVLAWLDSPLGRKLTHIEEMASTPEAYTHMVATLPSLTLTADYEERLELVHEIDRSVKATELILDRMLNMQVITLTALASAFPAMSLPSEETIRANFEKNRNSISQAVSREIALSILYTYRDISKEDIKDYIRFMKTDYGRRYHQVIQDGTNKAYVHCGRKFSQAVVRRIHDTASRPVEPASAVRYPQKR